MNKCYISIISGLLSLTSALAYAADAWKEASLISGVPVDIIQSVCIAESGVKFTDGYKRPWPYTLNSKMGPMFFKTKQEAGKMLSTLISKGYTNIDVGMCQINIAYHSNKATPHQLLDPRINLLVASTILKGLMNTYKGNLTKVVAAYHTGSLVTPIQYQRGHKYTTTVSTIQKRLAK